MVVPERLSALLRLGFADGEFILGEGVLSNLEGGDREPRAGDPGIERWEVDWRRGPVLELAL